MGVASDNSRHVEVHRGKTCPRNHGQLRSAESTTNGLPNERAHHWLSNAKEHTIGYPILKSTPLVIQC